MKRKFIEWTPRFVQARLDVERAEEILTDFARRGYTPTLRQLYYRFVANGWIPNTERSYKNLGTLLSQARRAGLIDWNHMVDRMRGAVTLGHWSSPAEIIQSAAAGYHIDLWEGQPFHVEVWVEKDALVDVVARAANEWDVGYTACRGYLSDSEMYQSAQRHRSRYLNGQKVIVLYLGDHDPSGLDMTRDVTDRLEMFSGYSLAVEVRRIALNMDQIEQYNPPPNPAKVTDSRFEAYLSEYGEHSWELDALDPDVIVDLITAELETIVDRQMFDARKDRLEHEKLQLAEVRDRWDEVVELLGLDV